MLCYFIISFYLGMGACLFSSWEGLFLYSTLCIVLERRFDHYIFFNSFFHCFV